MNGVIAVEVAHSPRVYLRVARYLRPRETPRADGGSGKIGRTETELGMEKVDAAVTMTYAHVAVYWISQHASVKERAKPSGY